jgi:hypothetical protein
MASCVPMALYVGGRRRTGDRQLAPGAVYLAVRCCLTVICDRGHEAVYTSARLRGRLRRSEDFGDEWMDLAWLLVMYIHLTGATAQKEAVHTDRFETQEACVAAAQQVQFELAARIRWSCIQRGGRPPLVKGSS